MEQIPSRDLTLEFNIELIKKSIEDIVKVSTGTYKHLDKNDVFGTYRISMISGMLVGIMSLTLKKIDDTSTQWVSQMTSASGNKVDPAILARLQDEFLNILSKALTGETIDSSLINKNKAGCLGAITIFLILTILYISGCQTKFDHKPYKAYSDDQEKVINKVKYFEEKHLAAPNQLSKDNISKASIDSVTRYIVDSMKYHIKNAKVRMTEMDVVPISGVYAFVAKFHDKDENEYWMEFDFPKEESIYQTPQYKLLKDMPENVDTILSFFYMADLEWQSYDKAPGKFKMQVVPFAKNFNFDSAKVANAKENTK